MISKRTKRYYAGIGSRTAPLSVQNELTRIASSLEARGLILRSGGAEGADLAFERGIKNPDMKEIWLPWHKFNGSQSPFVLENPIPPEVESLSRSIYSRWDESSLSVKRLHARNAYQILGNDLNTPVEFVACWTPRPETDTGGTMFGVTLAKSRGIPVYNLYYELDAIYFESLKIHPEESLER